MQFLEARKHSLDVLIKENELIISWLIQKKDGTTRRNYEREVKNFFKLFPALAIKDIKISHITKFLNSRENLSESSKRFSKDAVSSLLTFCVKVGYLPLNPTRALDPIRVPDRTSQRSLSVAQVKRIISKADTRRDQMIAQLLYISGMRRAELSKLKWKNFFEKGEQVQIVITGKGNKTRSVIIKRELFEELKWLRLDRDNDKSFVFKSQMGKSISPSQILRIVKALAKKARVTANVSPHWLRHAHATHSLNNGAPIHLVQKTLGHASIATTGKYLDAHPNQSSGEYLD